MRFIKPLALVVLGCMALLSLVVGFAAPLYEANFNERRERFEREGAHVTEQVLAKVIGRKGRSLVCGREGSPLPADGEQPVGRWVRVSPATFEKYEVRDRIELLVIGEEAFIRNAEFYSVLTYPQATILFGVTGVLFVFVCRWKPRALDP